VWSSYHLARRLWPLAACMAIALAAYFQARGISHLVAAVLLPLAPPPAATTPTAPAPAPPDADPILSRNLFHSSAESDTRSSHLPVTPSATPIDPRLAPNCAFGALTLTLVRDDASLSLAAVRRLDGKSGLASLGDVVGDHTLSRIGYRRIWFRKGDDRCQMVMGDDEHIRKSRRTARRRAAPPPRRTRLPKRIADRIQRLGPDELRVDRALVEEVLASPQLLTRRVRVRPMRQGEDVVGMQLGRIRAGTLLHELGLRNGDVLRTINGFDFSSPEQALHAYGRLRLADRLTLELQREGRATTIDIHIQ
jgi:general secretion pathway protein C